jgi:glycogen debranching enzyme
MPEVIQVENEFYIRATSAMVDDRTRVLKQGETFAIFNRRGDIQPMGLGEQGIYHEGTRFVSRLELRLFGHRPWLLGSIVYENNAVLAVDLTHPDVVEGDRPLIPRSTVHVFRTQFLWHGVCYDRLRFANYGGTAIVVPFALTFDADYSDIFEVRGKKRPKRGRHLESSLGECEVVLGYEGLDHVTRHTRFTFSRRPSRVGADAAAFSIELAPKQEVTVVVTIACESEKSRPRRLAYDAAFAEAGNELSRAEGRYCRVRTSNAQFNDWLSRSLADLRMMVTQTSVGPFPYAGVPWFSAAFGRDGIITALAALWLKPELASGVLRYLAATQSDKLSPAQDAEPGKILHEMRDGEMARLGEIPFARYYGSVDATPLFVILAGAYYDWTGDLPLIRSLWPNIEAALRWCDEHGDFDKDGFVEYARRSEHGLLHQGWKDSLDSVFHSDGALAEPPIALCEVQAYVYAAKRSACDLCQALGYTDRAQELARQAWELRERFERTFWCEELSTYAMALDGQKRPCRIRTSNAGHCLFAGIAGHERAHRVAATLMEETFFSGWGIRTLSTHEPRYNPMSYHNGSVWPHDNALIALGMAQYGRKEYALEILSGLFRASAYVELHRLPELFCGFERQPYQGPILYPVACAPQAWSAASVFLLLKACLGLSVYAPKRQVFFSHPVLPDFLDEVIIEDLKVGNASVDVTVIRYPRDVGITVRNRKGPAEVVVVK